MELKEVRKSKSLTQSACAEYLGIPLRTYQNYENDETKRGSMKYKYMVTQLEQFGHIDENTGLLTMEQIQNRCSDVLEKYDVDYCYLFGSYAKGDATPSSDVDLLVCTREKGISFYDMVEALREALKKRVDVLNTEQLSDNPNLVNEILKDGVKIYG